jgi:hypothetical protein
MHPARNRKQLWRRPYHTAVYGCLSRFVASLSGTINSDGITQTMLMVGVSPIKVYLLEIIEGIGFDFTSALALFPYRSGQLIYTPLVCSP